MLEYYQNTIDKHYEKFKKRNVSSAKINKLISKRNTIIPANFIIINIVTKNYLNKKHI